MMQNKPKAQKSGEKDNLLPQSVAFLNMLAKWGINESDIHNIKFFIPTKNTAKALY